MRYALWVVLCFLFFIPLGCGYQMVGKETHVPPGLNSVAIPTFKNHTFEPGIEVPFTKGFLTKFIRDRRVSVVDRATADSILEGVVKSYYVHAVSYNRSGYVAEYQVNVVIDVSLKKRTGEVLWQEKDLSEKQWFRASSQVLINESNKQVAIERIGRDAADRIQSRFFSNF